MSVTLVCRNRACGASNTIDALHARKENRCQRCGGPLSGLAVAEPSLSPPPNYLGMETDIEMPVLGESFPFAGRYQLIRPLGRGGMGEISLAYDLHLNREVALKIPRVERTLDRIVRARFQREAQAAASLEHPNICPIYDIGEYLGQPYFTMAYVQGETLSEVLKREGPFDPSRASRIARTLAIAMEVAHQRDIIHRDLKPANVMITPEGKLVLVDFGLARRLDHPDTRITVTGEMVGTPWYMAPEQVEDDDEAIGPRSDIYALGVILYELLTKRLPFEGKVQRVLVLIQTAQAPRPSTHRPDLPADLEAICLKAIARNPRDRFPTMFDFADALDNYLRHNN